MCVCGCGLEIARLHRMTQKCCGHPDLHIHPPSAFDDEIDDDDDAYLANANDDDDVEYDSHFQRYV